MQFKILTKTHQDKFFYLTKTHQNNFKILIIKYLIFIFKCYENVNLKKQTLHL